MATREIRTIFAIDGQQKYTDAIKSINTQQKNLRAEMKAASAQYDLVGDKQGNLRVKIDSLNKQIDLQRQKIAETRHAMEESIKKHGENSETTQQLTRDYHYAEAGLADYQKQLVKANQELELQTSKLKAVGDAAKAAGDKMQAVGQSMDKVGTALTKTVTAPLVAAAGFSAKAAMDFESAFAGVTKTVDGTTEQLAALETGIREMALEVPTAATEIANVAEAAGQLGIETDNVLGFTRVMIDLGEATNLSATEGATQLAKFANIMQMSQTDFNRLGSSIVALGNNSATTEADITAMALRLAGAGKQVGMSEADILGLSAALSSVGIEAEAGGSAMSKVMVEIQLAALNGGESLDNFAKVAGMSSEDFAKAYEEDAVGAINAFVVGLGGLDDKGGSAIQTLEDMGISEVRMRDALLRAAGAGDILTESIALSSAAWKDNNALTKEAAQRYATTESQLRISKNRINDAAITIGKQLLPVVADVVDDVAKAAASFAKLDPKLQKTILMSLAVAAAMGPVVKTLGMVTTGVGKASSAIGKFTINLAKKKAAEAGAAAATTGLSSATGGLTAVLNPAALAIAAAALAAGGLYLAYQESTRAAREAGEAGEEFAAGIANWRADVDSATSALEGFNMETLITAEEMSEFDAGISDAQGRIIELAKLAASESREYTEAERIEIENLIGLINDYTQKKIDAYQQQAEVVAAMASRETEVTLSRANELIKGAEDAKDQTLAIAEAKYKDLIGLAETEYGHLGERDKEAYDAQIDAAEAAYKSQVDAANKTHGETLAIIQEKYADYNREELSHAERLSELADEYENLEQRKTDKLSEMVAARKEQLGADTLSSSENARLAWEADTWYRNEKVRINEDLKTEYEALGQANLDNWIGMVAETELYGGQVDKKTKELIDGIIASFDLLPEDSREAALNSMQALYDGMEEKEPGLFRKASSIAGGIVKRIKDGFQISSPSKVFRGIGNNNIDSLALGMEDERDKAIKQAGEIAKDIVDEAASAPDIQTSISMRIRNSGLGAQIDASGTSAMQLREKARTVSDSPGTSSKLDVSGTIIHKGINDRNELVGEARSVMEQLKWETLLNSR